MKKTRIIVDQALDIPDYIVERYGMKVINLSVTFGDEPSNDISNKEFYKKMKLSPVLPKTSCPSPDKFLDEYKKGDQDIIVVSLSDALSGTYGSAMLAREIYMSENSKNKVTIINSKNCSIGSALLVIKIAKLIEEGKDHNLIMKYVNKMVTELIHYATLETIENVVKGGRMSKSKGFLVNALNLKPILKIENTVFVVDKGRGTRSSLKKMVELVDNDILQYNKKVTLLAIAHSNDLEKAQIVKNMMLEKYNFEEVLICEIGPVIGTYTAEGAVLLSVI